MAKRGRTSAETVECSTTASQEVLDDDFSPELIREINKDLGQRVAYNLATDDAPTIVKRWISTGSTQLDYAIAGKRSGGVPEGRIIEIFGPPAIGKSHLAYHMASNVQAMGGLVVYIDTENATPVEKLADMGIDVTRRFVYADSHCTEEVFTIAESTITKAKSLMTKKDIPILLIWDSVAATSPKAELEGEYDQNSIGLNARVISKGMRKIVGVIGQNNVTFLCLNQIRMKVGGFVLGDPSTTPGGLSIPFHASVRIKLTGGALLKSGEEVIGIKVHANIIKNKVSRPFRKVNFDIIFGKGIVEHEHVLEVLKKAAAPTVVGSDGVCYTLVKTGQSHNEFTAVDRDGVVLCQEKFTKNSFADVWMGSTATSGFVRDMYDAAVTSGKGNANASEIGGEESE